MSTAGVYQEHPIADAPTCRALVEAYDAGSRYVGARDQHGNAVVYPGWSLRLPALEVLQQVADRCLGVTSSHQGASLYLETVLLACLHDGQGHEAHADNVRLVNHQWVPNHTPHRDFAGVLYLNDTFSGGRLRFARPELADVVPMMGLYVTFPCTATYVHEVEPVGSGSRYTAALWFTRNRANAHPWSVDRGEQSR
jgi:predicted 2-oxoglutarate/Fe(II)-dependent dioxygenase YbiX